MTSMHETARALVAQAKGILAADESSGTIAKRFDSIGTESTEDARRRYRQLLFTTPRVGDHISGAILFDETIRQSADDGRSFVQVLTEAGVIPGIKVDTGAKPLALFPGETVTEGLDGLRERLAEYVALGARFAKWRATILIGANGSTAGDSTAGDSIGVPTDGAIEANAHAMARYAALCQEAGVVPIVEPEILMDGDHDIAACEAATGRTLDALYRSLAQARVDLPGTLLKVNMIVPGTGCATQDDDVAIAEATIRCLTANVPTEVPGVVFLSGGMGDEQATSRLNEMNRIGGGPDGTLPWRLSFSYGRALQAPSLAAWRGDDANVAAAQAALSHRARMNGLATSGDYRHELETSAA